MNDRKWDARIARARELAVRYSFAAEGLAFYERMTRLQESLYADLASQIGAVRVQRLSGTLQNDFQLSILGPKFAPFLAGIADIAPGVLADAARGLCAEGRDIHCELLTKFWRADWDAPASLPPVRALLARIFLQAYAEYLADITEPLAISATPPRCPLCDCPPQVGVLRPEGDGAKRSLICSLCAHEWEFRRIVCTGCGEEDPHKLAVYSAQELSHVRVEASDSCRGYINTIDLTKDGRAVPIVDELAAIPLNLWATEHGYTHSQTNLLGI